MSKRINSFWRLLLGSLIALLGFGACAKKVQPEEEEVVLYGPPPAKVERQDRSPKMRHIDKAPLLYGARPARIKKKSE